MTTGLPTGQNPSVALLSIQLRRSSPSRRPASPSLSGPPLAEDKSPWLVTTSGSGAWSRGDPHLTRCVAGTPHCPAFSSLVGPFRFPVSISIIPRFLTETGAEGNLFPGRRSRPYKPHRTHQPQAYCASLNPRSARCRSKRLTSLWRHKPTPDGAIWQLYTRRPAFKLRQEVLPA